MIYIYILVGDRWWFGTQLDDDFPFFGGRRWTGDFHSIIFQRGRWLNQQPAGVGTLGVGPQVWSMKYLAGDLWKALKWWENTMVNVWFLCMVNDHYPWLMYINWYIYWLVVCLEHNWIMMDYDFPFSWEFHHPNWRTPSFFRGVGIPPTRYICFKYHLIYPLKRLIQLNMNCDPVRKGDGSKPITAIFWGINRHKPSI